MTDTIRLPHDGSPWPEAARAWLSKLGCPETDIDGVLGTAPPFAPATLKQVLTGVMGLGRRAGRLGETMALLGHLEAEFRRLREDIGIPRAAPPTSLVPAAVLVHTADGWMAPGGWIPDILDRAAGRDVFSESGAPCSPLPLADLKRSGAQHVFVMGKPEETAPDAIALQSGISADDIHVVASWDTWLTPSPALPLAVFEAASRMHGLPAVFSSQESSGNAPG